MEQLHRYQQPCAPVGAYPTNGQIVDKQRQHHQHLDAKLDHRRNHIGDGDRESREVNLAEDIGIGGKGTCILIHAAGKEDPDGIAAHVEQNAGNTIGTDAGNATEDEGIDDGADQRIQKQPRRAQDCLLVGDCECPLGEQPNKIPVLPDLFQVQAKHPVFGRYVGVIFF